MNRTTTAMGGGPAKNTARRARLVALTLTLAAPLVVITALDVHDYVLSRRRNSDRPPSTEPHTKETNT